MITDTKNFINDLSKNGVVVIPSVYSKEQILELTELFKKTENRALSLTNMSKPRHYNYYTHFDKEYCSHKNMYNFSNINVLELVKGRFDISFNYSELKTHPIIEAIVNQTLKKQYSSQWGLLTSKMGSDNGPWHRDVINIDGDSDENGNYNDWNMVHNMSPFYYTILIPLVPLNKENGTPEFIKGSHKLTYSEIEDCEKVRFDTTIGDAIIFDGRIFHRGCKNLSQNDRPVMYNMIHRDWYTETGL